MDFITITIGVLSGLVPVGVNVASEAIYDKITKRDLSSLLEGCLAEAVGQKRDLLQRAAAQGEEPYLDRERLREYLENNGLVEPLVSELGSRNQWRPYLQPFQNIVVIPGCSLAPSDHLDLVEGVLQLASKIFTTKVPSSHPAFEQVLLMYQQKHSTEHGKILSRIESLPTEVAKRVKEPPKAITKRARDDGEWVNPFSVVAADDLDLNNPEDVRQIRHLFISRYTDLPTIRKHFNTVLEGQRGTGKTMILKYLGFQTQILEWSEEHGKKPEEFLAYRQNFIGVYSKLAQGVYDKSDFEAVDGAARREQIFEHRLVLQLIHDVLETMKSVYSYSPPKDEWVRKLKQALQQYLKTDGSLDLSTSYLELIETAQYCINTVLIPEVDEHLGSLGPGSQGGPTVFNPRLKLSGQLLPFVKLLQSSCSASVPFFLMLDDFDVLEPFQQSCVFQLASQREYSTVCLKFGIMALGKKVSLSGSQRTFRAGDDYDPVNLDWTAGGLSNKYQNAVLEIASARLCEGNWPGGLHALLPEWQRGKEIREEVEVAMRAEWTAFESKPTEVVGDYISKYGNARFYQTLRRRKIRIRYAGVDSVTMVSSGIFRQFLEICKLIFDRAYDGGWLLEQGGVSPEIQDEAVREYSQEMVKQFSGTAGDAQSLLLADIEVTSLHMITLIESLCDLFYSRLHSPGHGEPEVFCIAVRDDLDSRRDATTYLNIAVRESILHRFEYPPKTPGGPPLPTFMLNRRLGPRRDLSITHMQGRIEVSADDVLLAVQSRKQFFKKMTGGDADQFAQGQQRLPLSGPGDGAEAGQGD